MNTTHIFKALKHCANTFTKSAALSLNRLIERKDHVSDSDDNPSLFEERLLSVGAGALDALYAGLSTELTIRALSSIGINSYRDYHLATTISGTFCLTTIACVIFGFRGSALSHFKEENIPSSVKESPMLAIPSAILAYGNQLALGTLLANSAIILALSQMKIPLNNFMLPISSVGIAGALPWTLGLLASLWVSMTTQEPINVHERTLSYSRY